MVLLHSSEAVVKSELRFKLVWFNQMRSMLGNKYKVLRVFRARNGAVTRISLPSPDGSDRDKAQNRGLHFPTSVITKIGTHILLS